MRFKVGDTTDADHCIAIQHEFLRCQDAFKDFEASATEMILQGENRFLAYKTYNAYSRWIHHLYELLLALGARDIGNTRQFDASEAERYIAGEAQRILTRTRAAIIDGTAPVWENDISYYPSKIPPRFARDFRECRNLAYGHISHKRAHLDLAEFYERNHKFLYLFYRDILDWWSLRAPEFPDLKEITDFSIAVKARPLDRKDAC